MWQSREREPTPRTNTKNLPTPIQRPHLSSQHFFARRQPIPRSAYCCDHAEQVSFAAKRSLALSPFSAIVGTELHFVKSGISFQHQRCCCPFESSTTDPRPEPPSSITPSDNASIAGEPAGSSRAEDRQHRATSISALVVAVSALIPSTAPSVVAQFLGSGINDGQFSAGHFCQHRLMRQRQGGEMEYRQGNVDGVALPMTVCGRNFLVYDTTTTHHMLATACAHVPPCFRVYARLPQPQRSSPTVCATRPSQFHAYCLVAEFAQRRASLVMRILIFAMDRWTVLSVSQRHRSLQQYISQILATTTSQKYKVAAPDFSSPPVACTTTPSPYVGTPQWRPSLSCESSPLCGRESLSPFVCARTHSYIYSYSYVDLLGQAGGRLAVAR